MSIDRKPPAEHGRLIALVNVKPQKNPITSDQRTRRDGDFTVKPHRLHSTMDYRLWFRGKFGMYLARVVQGGRESLWWILHLRFDGNVNWFMWRKNWISKSNSFFSFLFFLLDCNQLITKVKLSQRTISRNLTVAERKYLNHLARVGSNSDFMILDAWMSILRNFSVSYFTGIWFIIIVASVRV